VSEGAAVPSGTRAATLAGSTRDLLTAERVVLNLVGRLSGIATLTQRYVAAIAGTRARIYDTRKTTPGWRRLEKYAVGCGGGRNHRTGLFDAVLIKDNHLAQAAAATGMPLSPAAAVRQARAFLDQFLTQPAAAAIPLEIEVDTLDQLQEVLPLAPDLILLDNMTTDQLRAAVRLRDQAGVGSELEASGGITLETIREVAETGVDRISVGALTHSASSLDVALDWD
jgi:nicotinate-nucleotide pyrophosphorylase (carboxylating)